MASRGTKAMAAKRTRPRQLRTHVQVSPGPRISRARLRMVRENLDATRNSVTDTFAKFWTTSEQDIRETLARTQQKIGRAVDMLKRAA